jgi:lipid II:glycine glycyltransferase (peptidoglycan interpeptide bridge formation enzyme)
MKLENYNMIVVNNDTEWHNLLRQFDDANIYQTWNYARIVQDEKRLEHLAFYRNEILIGLAQVRIKILPVLNRGIAYIFSGPVWRKNNQQTPVENLLSILQTLKTEYVINKKLLLRFRPYIFSDESNELNINAELFNELNFKRLTKEYHSLLLNTNEDLETIKKNLRPRWRNYLNQSTKNKLHIVSGSDTGLYYIFVTLYNQMMDRKDFTEYVDPVKMGNLNANVQKDFKLKVFIAYKDDEAVAGLVGTAIGKTGIYLLGATNNLGLELRASYLLHWEMIKWMQDMKCFRYDLGGINKLRNPGGFKFKSGISDVEISDIGTYECSPGGISKLIITAAEKIKRK